MSLHPNVAKQHKRRSRHGECRYAGILAVLLTVLLGSALLYAAVVSTHLSTRAIHKTDLDDVLSQQLRPRYTGELRDKISHERLKRFANLLWHDPNLATDTTSLVLHIIDAFGNCPQSALPDGLDTNKLIQDLLTEKSGDENNRLISTLSGARFLTRPSYSANPEAHPGQALYILAKQQISPSFTFVIGDERYSVLDLVNDCQATFSLSGELEWATLAVLLFDPSCSSISNRVGESIALNDIVEKLIDRPLGYGSCRGAHVLEALSLIELLGKSNVVDLPQSTKTMLSEYLDCVAKSLIGEISKTGYISAHWGYSCSQTQIFEDWCEKYAPLRGPQVRKVVGDFESHVNATAHLCLWLLSQRSRCNVTPEIANALHLFLLDSLVKLVHGDAAETCAKYHAFAALAALNLDSK